MLKECRMHIYSRDKCLSRIGEHLDMFLFKLRSPEIRPKEAVVSEIESIRDSVAKLQASKPKTAVITPPERVCTSWFTRPSKDGADAIQLCPQLRPVTCNTSIRPKPSSVHENVQCELDKQRMRKLRSHNTALMDNLNDLRFDRLSLRRKLHDAQFQLKSRDTWVKRQQ